MYFTHAWLVHGEMSGVCRPHSAARSLVHLDNLGSPDSQIMVPWERPNLRSSDCAPSTFRPITDEQLASGAKGKIVARKRLMRPFHPLHLLQLAD